MSAAFAVSLFPYYNNVFFLPSFCPFCFSSFCLFPIFFCFVSDSGVFLPALLAVLFFLFQKIFSFSFPAFCRTSFRSSCLHHPSALNRPVRPALQSLYRLFLLFACIVRFSQRPSCPKFHLSGLYNLCPLPAFPVGLEPICLPRFTGPLPSFYFSLVSFVFRKDLPVRNSVSMVFTVFAPYLHHHQPENRPVRESVSTPHRFSCRPFAPSLFSVAFALFSVFSLQVLSPLWVQEFFSFSLSVFCTIFPIDPFSLFLPFTFSLNLLSYPHGLALAPLAFSLRLSIWKIFPFLIYINELTLSILFRDKNDVPKLFLLLAWHISLSSNLFSH